MPPPDSGFLHGMQRSCPLLLYHGEPEITAEWETGVAEWLAEEAYVDLITPSDVYEAEQELDRLAGQAKRLYKDLYCSSRMMTSLTEQFDSGLLRPKAGTRR